MRLRRADAALRVLDTLAVGGCTADELLTIRMLTGAAHVRRGEFRLGLGILLDAQARSADVHPTIASELALHVAQARYGLGDFDGAERAVAGVAEDADIVSARAWELRGWLADAVGDKTRAKHAFVHTLAVLDRCAYRDRHVEVNAVRALAHHALDRLDADAWAIVETRWGVVRLWDADAVRLEARFWVGYCVASYRCEVLGDYDGAALEARTLERIAPTRAARVEAMCTRASIMRAAGEPVGHRDHVRGAAELLAQIPADEFVGDERNAPLLLAEEAAWIDAAVARRAFEIYCSLRPVSAMQSVAHDPAGHADVLFVEGVVLEAEGAREAAIDRYRTALAIFERTGYVRRAVQAAARLAALTGVAAPLHALDARARRLPDGSALRRALENARSATLHLTEIQREILALVCAGKSNPEIALLRKRSLHTVRNHIARLFEIFEVGSREELAVACVRRGLAAPRTGRIAEREQAADGRSAG